MRFPTLSIIIATYNSERTLRRCLKSIRSQDYPQKLVEIILVDGGSIDKTLAIAREYQAKIIQKLGVAAEAAKSYGLKMAKGELVADFGSDNILPKKTWLKEIIFPLSEDKSIIASQRYTYRKKDTVFNRYVALFGVNDPVPFYLSKADRQSYLTDKYLLAGKAKDGGAYYQLIFTPENLPTVGANGFVIRKNILKKAKVDPEHYFHIDVIYDLVCQGYNKFAVVKTSIIHDTADTLFSLLKKRGRYFSSLYLEKLNKRRYHLVKEKDIWKLLLFIFFSLTLIQPLFISFLGYRKKRDLAWFVHPIFCLLITLVYAKEVLKKWLKNYL
jgi:glycosyltransferase involved in cell wall biosynthesis